MPQGAQGSFVEGTTGADRWDSVDAPSTGDLIGSGLSRNQISDWVAELEAEKAETAHLTLQASPPAPAQ